MKFRFTGDTDAPDWLLAEIATLSRISSVRMKLIAKQVLLKMVTGSMDYEKVLRLLTPKGAARASVSDTKGSIAALHFVVENAAKFGVDETTLHQETVREAPTLVQLQPAYGPTSGRQERISDSNLAPGLGQRGASTNLICTARDHRRARAASVWLDA